MKRALIILLLSIALGAQSQPAQDDFFATAGTLQSVNAANASRMIESTVARLSDPRFSDHQRLKKTFRLLHSGFLKKYVAYSGYDEMFSTGNYDCLTATALFSHVLTKLNFSYDIIETNYHIFLMVHTAKGDILLETTDRFGGIVVGESAIATRIDHYKQYAVSNDNAGKFIYQYSFDLFQKIAADKLTGLLYFNQAVKSYNNHDWIGSARSLEKANALYASPRCDALGNILMQTVMKSGLEEKSKNECLIRLRCFWAKKADVLALN